jgi:hypothetical protein
MQTLDELEDEIQRLYWCVTLEGDHAQLYEQIKRLREERDRRYDTWPMARLLEARATARNVHLRASFHGELMERRIAPIFAEGQPLSKSIEDLHALLANFPGAMISYTRAQLEERLHELEGRHLAVMMGAQRRLGDRSVLYALEPDLLRLITDQ